jgi:alanine-glyoxylate transaminase/serine-glyoxylate transaminase/serine-pyruvate transaminase
MPDHRPRIGDLSLAARLRRELEGEVLFDPVSRGLYSTDASIYQIEPVGVVVPRTVQDVKTAIEIAVQEGVPVLPRGAGVEPQLVEDRLRRDTEGRIRAVMVVHNETSTGVTSNIPDIRAAIDAAGHPALFMVDTVSSLASIDFRHDEWGVDVTVTGSQKGLMLPPGLGFTAASERALAARPASPLPHSYFNWDDHLAANASGFFPYTPATTLLFGLRESLAMLAEEGLDQVFARHRRFAEATRAAVAVWDLECYSINPCEHSSSLTAVLLPEGHDANALRQVILERFDMSLGTGLGKLDGRVFRIGHLGDLNELTLAGTLAGVEMGLRLAQVPHSGGGVDAALQHLAMASPTQE